MASSTPVVDFVRTHTSVFLDANFLPDGSFIDLAIESGVDER